MLLAALQSPERVRSLTLIEPAFGSLLPEAGAGLADEKVSRSAALAKVRALVDAERHDDAAVAFIDWVQGGAGGFARLPESTQSGLRENARTLGPTIAGSQPDVSPASLRALRVPTLVVNGAQTRAFYRLIGEVTTASIPGAKLHAAGRLRPHDHRREPGRDDRAPRAVPARVTAGLARVPAAAIPAKIRPDSGGTPCPCARRPR